VWKPSVCPDDLKLRSAKSVAVIDVVGLITFSEPGDPLLGNAMSEWVRHDIAVGLAFQFIIANRARGAQRFLDIAAFDDMLDPVGMMRPDDGDMEPIPFPFHYEVSKTCGIGFVAARLCDQVEVTRLHLAAVPRCLLLHHFDLLIEHLASKPVDGDV
jgi:hypothetical protein